MKKTFLFIMGLVVSLSLSAQKVMRVEMNDGSVAKYSTADIKQITFEDAMLVGSAVDLGLLDKAEHAHPLHNGDYPPNLG